MKPLTIVHDPADWTAESLAGKEVGAAAALTYTYLPRKSTSCEF